MSFKCDNLIEQVSYRDKTPPPIDWGLFALDSIRLLQFWDKIASLPLSEPETLSIGHNIRTFLTDEPLMNTTPLKPQVDPVRFQALDRIITRRKWFPTVTQSKCNHNTGFPSDHFLVQIKIKVKLGSRPPVIPRAPKLDYSSSARVRESLQASFRAAYATHAQTHTTEGTREYTIYTDGSGSRGRATSASPAGWGVHIRQGHSVIEGYGRVNTDRTSAFFLGATVGSNNTAELTAIIEAMLFLLHESSRAAKVVIYYDSKWAAQMTKGKTRPKSEHSSQGICPANHQNPSHMGMGQRPRW